MLQTSGRVNIIATSKTPLLKFIFPIFKVISRLFKITKIKANTLTVLTKNQLSVNWRIIASKKIELFGENQILTWDGLNDYGHELPSGVYILSFQNGPNVKSKKVTLLK